VKFLGSIIEDGTEKILSKKITSHAAASASGKPLMASVS